MNASPTLSVLSSGWEADSDREGLCEEKGGGGKKTKRRRRKGNRKRRDYPSEKGNNKDDNIFSRGLRKAKKCIGIAVLATGRKFSPSGRFRAEKSGRIGGLDKKAGNKNVRNGSKDVDRESAFGKAVRIIKRKRRFWKKEPERLKPAKERMMLDE